MKNTKFYYSVIIPVILLTITSCNRDIDIKLNNATGQLVIEANLTNVNGPQYVILSKNVPFTSTNTYPPVSGAMVTISDQSGHSYQLNESPAGTYSYYNLAGIPGVTYTLTVKVNGQTYTANSTMPLPVLLDSISAQNQLISNNNQKQIVVYYQDPVSEVNQYRFVEYVNGTQVNNIFAYNDSFTNGKYVNDVLGQDDIAIYPADTVMVEMQCINQAMYTYWYTLEQEEGNSESPQTAAPANPPTNITPTTLGYFSAHTTQTKMLVVPK